MKKLVDKSRKSLREDGLKGFLIKTKNWTVYQFKRSKLDETMKDILFINGCGLPHPERYRVDHQIEQLESSGLTVDKVFYTEVNPEMVKFYRGVIIFRCPFTESVGKLVDKAHYFNKRVFFDIDDLVIDRKYTDTIEYIRQMDKEERAEYDSGVEKMGKTMKICDYCITTTPALARELEKYGKEVFINKNVASERMVKLSLDAVKRVKKDGGKIRIGYLSGSITHNPDFEMIKPALIKIMDEFSNVELVVMGHLDLPDGLERFRSRIIERSFESWEKLPGVIAELDVNLAPIEKTVFNEAKSENKWMEAALCRVATVASDFGAFHEVIEDKKTGMLCKNGEDWYKNIKELVENSELRIMIAQNAHEKAMKEYITTYSGVGLAKFIESRLARNIAFVLPSTNISGGVNVVLKHCEILRREGSDVMIINMDVSDDNIRNDGGEINVISGVKHNFCARFDSMVATLYTTLEYVRRYPGLRKRYYLVQNFETDFNDYGCQEKRVANATYVITNGVSYITISEWCKKWLKEDFGQDVRYAPNGIDVNKFEFKEREFVRRKVRILIEGNSDDYYKNVDESFRVAEKLNKDKYEIVYLSYQGEPKKWYRVDKFYHRVPHDEVGKVYKECDILLKTSILESFSYPPLEMMATGGYVVAVPNEGNREYLVDGKNCLFYNQGDIDGAVEKIERIVKDPELRGKLREGARKVVAMRDWDGIEKKIVKLYE
ncbi:MAG: glycosyltransferase [Candidatus Saccharibacteria bacterium]|nr:glycosyltransferase [Candidatus Saccharibacteria bacterium]